ncbi:MAG: MerC domain-containing protein [Wenzhouxiangellaceae bacterium]|nr:MerC domain-containing protein [Wenzhouxiangellaceae bacterium]
MAAVMESRETEAPVGWLDRLGIGVSAFCLLQCLALPLVLVLAPAASAGFLSHELFHVVLLAVVIPVSGLAFAVGFARHRNARMWIPAGLGFAVLVSAAVLEREHVLGPVGVALLTSTGGAFLIVGHLMNLRSRGEA